MQENKFNEQNRQQNGKLDKSIKKINYMEEKELY